MAAFSPLATDKLRHLDFPDKTRLTKSEKPLQDTLMLPWGVRFHKKYTFITPRIAPCYGRTPKKQRKYRHAR
jgi:hypothetical protein